uniref:Uncharacterized protein n=1 Tax=Anguilla anguilla TaxID=7936 RepID=A0A0E9XYI8_ANGAN
MGQREQPETEDEWDRENSLRQRMTGTERTA